MASSTQDALDETIAFLDTALEMREDMGAVVIPYRHMQSTKNIILSKIRQLCLQIHLVFAAVQLQPTEMQVIQWLQRMTAIKAQLTSAFEVFVDVDWTIFERAMTAGFHFLEGGSAG